MVVWLSSSFLQLVLLPIIIVGQNIQAKASDTRADETYKDAEAVLKEAAMIQDHLCKQDELISRILGQIGPLAPPKRLNASYFFRASRSTRRNAGLPRRHRRRRWCRRGRAAGRA